MAAHNFVICTAAFDWAGKRYAVGETLEDTATAYTFNTSKFSRQDNYVTGGIGTVLTGGTLGTIVAGKIPITDGAGTIIGYTPFYNGITGT